MRWVSRDDLHFDRIACCWLIARFIDYRAEVVLLGDEDLHHAPRLNAVAFALGGHRGRRMSDEGGFGALIASFGLAGSGPLRAMADAVRQARHRASLPGVLPDGLEMLVHGLETILSDRRQRLRQGFLLCDAIYASICQRLNASGWEASATRTPPIRHWAPKPRRAGRRLGKRAMPDVAEQPSVTAVA